MKVNNPVNEYYRIKNRIHFVDVKVTTRRIKVEWNPEMLLEFYQQYPLTEKDVLDESK